MATSLKTLQSAVKDAKSQVVKEQAKAALTLGQLKAVQSQMSPTHLQVLMHVQKVEDQTSRVAQTVEAHAVLTEQLHRTRSDVLGPDLAQDLRRLDPGVPLALFPARLETRFVARTSNDGTVTRSLWVRIYPDEILAHTHETGLTASQWDAGVAYWTGVFNNLTDDASDAWRRLLASYAAPRAAWIMERTRPLNLPVRERPSKELPIFPNRASIVTSASGWSSAVEARLLPDRWIVSVYAVEPAGTVLAGQQSTMLVTGPLTLTTSPALGTPLETLPSGHVVDAAARWTVDFEAAKNCGMAVEVPLTIDLSSRPMLQVFAVGVAATLDPGDSVQELQALLTEHRFTRGLAFVAQGTPTNNSEGTPAGYPPADPGGALSYACEVEGLEPRDGLKFLLALGIEETEARALAAHLAGSECIEQTRAAAMNGALWPATLGYFLEQMADLGPTILPLVRTYFVERVRGRGHLPAFRIGGTPYGLLPVSSLDRWRPLSESDAFQKQLPELLRALRRYWLQQRDSAPHIGSSRSIDLGTDSDLLNIFSMDASAQQVYARGGLGPNATANMLRSFGRNPEPLIRAAYDNSHRLITEVGLGDWWPRIAQVFFTDPLGRFVDPFVTADPLSETTALQPVSGYLDYINWIRSASINDLTAGRLPEDFLTHAPLLFHLLRFAYLREYARVARDRVATELRATEGTSAVPRTLSARDPEFVGIPLDGQRTASPLEVFTAPVTVDGRTVVAADALGPHAIGPRDPEIATYDASLATLQATPTAELERLLTESLDLCATRLDAWITSLAATRLSEMRKVRPTGLQIGGYAWVDGLWPPSSGDWWDGQHPLSNAANEYLQAPSMTHAKAAAVLRNANVYQSQGTTGRYTLNLTSARVRWALDVLDQVREGQPIGAVLGYVFERDLHERRLDVYIDPARSAYPLVANKTVDSGQPAEVVAARNVVDGLAFWTDWRDHRELFVAKTGFDATAMADLRPAIDALEGRVDAVADLLVAESSYQLMKGNPAVAAASLKAIAGGLRPPDPEIARTPRSGTTLTHRIALLFDPTASPPDGWQSTPRAAAEPTLNAWVGRIFGPQAPTKFGCSVTYRQADTPGTDIHEVVYLGQLGLAPLDVLRLSGAASTAGSSGELDQRIRLALVDGSPNAVGIKIRHSVSAELARTGVRTFPELLELARSLVGALTNARRLRSGDLMLPRVVVGTNAPEPPSEEVIARARATGSALDALGSQLATAVSALSRVLAGGSATPRHFADVRDPLRMISLFGIAALPVEPGGTSPEDGASLVAQGIRVGAEISRRLLLASGTAANPVTAFDALATLLGSDLLLTQGVTPDLPPDGSTGTVLNVELFQREVAAEDVQTWSVQVAHVRPMLARWRRFALAARSLIGQDPGAQRSLAAIRDPIICQLPSAPGDAWAAIADPGPSPKSGLISFALLGDPGPKAGGTWCGLLLDEWSELIPSPEEDSAIAFHYDDPGAEAPQAVLIAVPPDPTAGWDTETLLAVLRETLDLAKIRAASLVDPATPAEFSQLGQFLPALTLAMNPDRDVISADLIGQMQANSPAPTPSGTGS